MFYKWRCCFSRVEHLLLSCSLWLVFYHSTAALSVDEEASDNTAFKKRNVNLPHTDYNFSPIESMNNKRVFKFGKKSLNELEGIDDAKRMVKFGKRLEYDDQPSNKRLFEFGKRKDEESKRMVRFGKRESDDEVSNQKRMVRFGKRLQDDEPLNEKRMVRFGKRLNDEVEDEKRMVRFGKRLQNNDQLEEKRMVRFGKRDELTDQEALAAFVDDKSDKKRMVRFGKKSFSNNEKRTVRFGKKSQQDKKMVKFGKRENSDKRMVRFGRNYLGNSPIMYEDYLFGNDGKRMVRFGKRRVLQFGKRNFNDVTEINDINNPIEKKMVKFGKRMVRFGRSDVPLNYFSSDNLAGPAFKYGFTAEKSGDTHSKRKFKFGKRS